jgi:hypothetical protein
MIQKQEDTRGLKWQDKQDNRRATAHPKRFWVAISGGGGCADGRYMFVLWEPGESGG